MALYRCMGGGEEATSITPSNASPVALTEDVAVKPTASGYAIASYSSVTPSDASPVTLTSGDIVKLGGNGKAVASVTDVTPSDSSPVSLASGTIYKMGGNGKAVANVNSITPSSSAPSMSSGSIYKPSTSGYAIDTYSSITPSASGTYFASGFRKMTLSGYAYTSQIQLKTGTYTTNSSSAVTISIGFVPDVVIVYSRLSETSYAIAVQSVNQGSFTGWNMTASSAGRTPGTFTWASDYKSFTHKAVNSNYSGRTANYIAYKL